MSAFLGTVDNLGRYVTKHAMYTLHVMSLAYLSIRATVTDKAQGFRQILQVISAQIYFTGWQALPLISSLGLGVGALMILQSQANLSLMGGTHMLGSFLILMILREAGPLLVALVVIARSGTAVASELGNMRANREIEALEVMGINPLSYIVFPRLIGGVISVLCLAFYFNLIALVGGFFVTRFLQDLSFEFYADSLLRSIAAADIAVFFLKNTFSGIIIFAVSCFQGLSVKRSHHEVPQVTTLAVVHSIIFVLIFNIFISALFYMQQLRNLGVIS
ncbi:ABC transporter permease protein [Bdellovibrio bacteriovorus W]|nr:ABC transporter permease protein [Bdellovibrio bacteriovorus W]